MIFACSTSQSRPVSFGISARILAVTSQAEDLPFAHRMLLSPPQPLLLTKSDPHRTTSCWLLCYIHLSAVASVVSMQMLLHRDASLELPPKQCPPLALRLRDATLLLVYNVTHGLLQSSPIRVLALQMQRFCLIYSYIPSAINIC